MWKGTSVSISKDLPVGNADPTIQHWLDLYHEQHGQLDVDHYASVPWWWLAAAFRALAVAPSLYPLAVVLGHLTSFLDSKRGRAAKMARNSPFTASNAQLALLGLDEGQVRRGLKILVADGLVAVTPRGNRPNRIEVLCGLADRRRLKAAYQGILDAGPASGHRQGGTRKQKGRAGAARKVVTVVTAEVARSLGASGWKEKTGKGAAGHATWVHSARGHTLRFAAKGVDGVEVLVVGLGHRDAERLTNDDEAVTMERATAANGDADPKWILTFNRADFAATFIGGLRKILVKAPRTRA